MVQPESKRQKIDTSTSGDPEYELIYWPGFPGRGEFVRLLFEYTQTPYKDTAQNVDADGAMKAVMDITSSTEHPVFAVPALRHGDVLLSQMPNILQYIAGPLGLASAPIHQLNAIVLTLLDGFVVELHDTHHPIAMSDYYENQKPEAKRRAKYFLSERLPKFMEYAQRLIDANPAKEKPWLCGDSLTYADLVLFQCLDGTQFAFPKTMEKLRQQEKHAGVFELYDAVKREPALDSYLRSDRRQKYSNGIYRHYPELEEED